MDPHLIFFTQQFPVITRVPCGCGEVNLLHKLLPNVFQELGKFYISVLHFIKKISHEVPGMYLSTDFTIEETLGRRKYR